MLEGGFYERAGMGACALGLNSYLSPLKGPLVESPAGEMTGFLMGGLMGGVTIPIASWLG